MSPVTSAVSFVAILDAFVTTSVVVLISVFFAKANNSRLILVKIPLPVKWLYQLFSS